MKRYLDGCGVKDCWFVYFGEEVIDFSYYGIPCKPLPTPDAMWTGEFAETPRAIDGPVLINAGCLSGWESGPGVLNPYKQFKLLQPSAVIRLWSVRVRRPFSDSLGSIAHPFAQGTTVARSESIAGSPRRGPASLPSQPTR